MIEMYDTVTVSAVPSLASTSSTAVAGYVDGRFANIAALEREFPNHHHLSIAVFASDDADCLDIETGDAVPAQAPGWVRRQHARGITRPVLYANLSTMPQVVAAIENAGIARQSVRLWMAHFDNVQEVPAGFDAHQYTDRALGRNLDASVCLDDFFSLPPAPKPVPAPVPKKKPIIKKPPLPHPKVTAAGIAGALSAGLLAFLQSHGLHVVHLTTAESDVITLVAALIAGYMTPSPNG